MQDIKKRTYQYLIECLCEQRDSSEIY